ncbi:MAG TPA: ThuA domain-containing protein [Pirellulales bacterium]|jgi:type 1 glutamine amidotransferase/nicotinamidase-related amidase|nr:ThuA domain-containing protein [Pirellulales bacterium]
MTRTTRAFAAAAAGLAIALVLPGGTPSDDCLWPWSAPATARADEPTAPTLQFSARSRVRVAPQSDIFAVRETPTQWDPRHTAIIICDMWDWNACPSATRRATELAPKINRVAAVAREAGVLIVHAPSNVMQYYQGTPQRKRAQEAPADPHAPADLDKGCDRLDGEPALPIDDSDGGCDCQPPCQPTAPRYKRQTDLIEIGPEDVISDSGREQWNLFAQRGIENVILMGVHANMCVLGRSFGLRQWARHGKNVVLVRDLTDAQYNPRKPPLVAHQRGTEMVVEHIEKYVCPSITSADLLGDPVPPHVVFLIGEDEYRTEETLPAFAASELVPRGVRCTFVLADPQDRNHFPNIAVLREADLLVLSVRRRVLPPAEIAEVHAYLDAGRPLVGIRTASHAFEGKTAEATPAWGKFDLEVLGADYLGHYSNKTPAGGVATLYQIVPEQAIQPLLTGIARGESRSASSLYKNHDLASTTTVLMTGHVEGQNEVEPVAWINSYRGGRIFYTSLGGAEDFQVPAFRRLLLSAVYWGLDHQVPAAE